LRAYRINIPRKFVVPPKHDSVGLEENFWFGRSKEVGDKLSFCAQSAYEWLNIFHLVRLVIADEAPVHSPVMQSRASRNSIQWTSMYLLSDESYQLEFNEQTMGRMSIASNVLHRQCKECPNWFSVHPGTFRPEKLFCSDACRMRAYRKRKERKRGSSPTARG
jgi:hypothetical protein